MTNGDNMRRSFEWIEKKCLGIKHYIDERIYGESRVWFSVDDSFQVLRRGTFRKQGKMFHISRDSKDHQLGITIYSDGECILSYDDVITDLSGKEDIYPVGYTILVDFLEGFSVETLEEELRRQYDQQVGYKKKNYERWLEWNKQELEYKEHARQENLKAWKAYESRGLSKQFSKDK